MKKELTRENMTAEDKRALQDLAASAEKITKLCEELGSVNAFCAKYANKMIKCLEIFRNKIYDAYGI